MATKLAILSFTVILGYIAAGIATAIGIVTVISQNARLEPFLIAAGFALNSMLLELFLDIYSRVRRIELHQETVLQLLLRRMDSEAKGQK